MYPELRYQHNNIQLAEKANIRQVSDLPWQVQARDPFQGPNASTKEGYMPIWSDLKDKAASRPRPICTREMNYKVACI